LLIYTENKPSDYYSQRWRGKQKKIKKSTKRYQNHIYQFQYKGDVLVKNLMVAHRSP
jgi:hypothetical protein